jgi:hypothetical protein
MRLECRKKFNAEIWREVFVCTPDRSPASVRASILLEDARVSEVLIQDISSFGFMCRYEGFSPEVGDEVRIVLPGVGIVSALVCWVWGIRMGARFREKLQPETLLALTNK